MTTDFGNYAYDIKTMKIRALLKEDITTDRPSNWLSNQESIYIESVLTGLPLTPIILLELEEPNEQYGIKGTYKVIDGVGRLTALRKFREDKLRLMDVNVELNLFNKVYSDFFPYKQEKFLDALFPLVIFERGLPKSMEKDVRLRYN